MKQRILSHITLIIFLLSIGMQIKAATTTPQPTADQPLAEIPTVSDKAKQIDDLKERLATKVAELKQSQRQAIYGTIKSVSISTFTVETATKNLKIELTDDIKIFQKLNGVRTALTTDDLAKGDIVTVFGEYDATLELLKAKIVFIQSADPIRVAGKITEVNKTDYTITIITVDSKTYTIDFETITKTSVWNGKELEKGGFSKLIVGDTIHVTGTAVAKQENRVSAARITNIGADVTGTVTTPSPTIAPTEKTASPTATIKPTAKTTPTVRPTTIP
jgi:hypothetical protein